MQLTIYFILEYCPIIPIVYGFSRYTRFAKPVKMFYWYLVVSLGITIFMTYLAFRGPNVWMINFGMIVYVPLILWMFSLWQEVDSMGRILLRALILLFYIIWFSEIIGAGRFTQFTTYSRPFEGLLFAFAACLTINRANKALDLPIVEKPEFWISSGILLYYGGVIIINLVSDHLLHISLDRLRDAFLILAILNLFSHLLYVAAFMTTPATKLPASPLQSLEGQKSRM